MSYSLLFVCTGNTCRSPMAAALARRILADRGHRDVTVASAGTSAQPGAPVSEEVPRVLEEIGVDLGDHAAAELGPEAVAAADLILVMSPWHREAVEAMGGGEKVALVTEFLEGEERGRPVTDPIGGGLEVYRRTRDQLGRAVEAVVVRLESASVL
ncbi:MAG: low molecular weight phosphatase family protein [Gemmatimonadota bacterium]